MDIQDFVITIVAFFVIATPILQCLWNMTMPEAFGLREISFWVAFRLILIGIILSGSFLRIKF